MLVVNFGWRMCELFVFAVSNKRFFFSLVISITLLVVAVA